MLKTYLAERRSWILLFFFLQLLTLSISYIDAAIPVGSILYIVFLSILLFSIFLILRYKKESIFYKALEERENHFDTSDIPTASTPFERIVEESMTDQAELLKKAASENRLAMEQEKDDLLYWIHEVKTPLTAMHLMIERMEDEPLKANLTYEWLRIHLLLDRQLHQKRIPFMENDLFIEQIELEPLIFNEIKTIQTWCIQKGIGFEVDLEETKVLSDTKWLSFILRQLLTNAVKYSDASEIHINSCHQDGQMILQVKDAGRGIDPKDLPRIFEKGFTSTTHHHDRASTGMGLYLAKKAAQPLLIDIQVESELGSGSTFTLTFPRRNEFVDILGV
ncbi:sensor histidine kinase [Pseudalkalibacillus salsuginis]|uniref:sensor histidine kinase n=1 Tax=Pseudalkalibacillus salsuginis TaxID=2910972 RepID=UPI001F2C59B4|nr:sensor histidine kinase [Pseudalkalibacillus salsuginis]MCF6411372.1 sensor histidine kinase [Pseudalkalibacillus salsuginis]